MPDIRQDIRRIQELTHASYLATGSVAALLDGKQMAPRNLAEALDRTAQRLESATVELRNLCETHRPNMAHPYQKRRLVYSEISGSVTVTESGWLHMELNTLLPSCRLEMPRYLTDTITRLLDDYECHNGSLPRFDTALLVLDEHCDIDNRRVFDQDNKGWKAVSNALKGRLFADDDQFTLGVGLVSTRAQTPCCHVYLLPISEAGDFFYLRQTEGVTL